MSLAFGVYREGRSTCGQGSDEADRLISHVHCHTSRLAKAIAPLGVLGKSARCGEISLRCGSLCWVWGGEPCNWRGLDTGMPLVV